MPRPKSVMIEARTADRMIRNSRYVDKMPRRRAGQDAPPVDFGGGYVLRVTVAVNGLSGSSPGISGRGVIQKFDGTTYTDASANEYKIVSDSDKTVAVGAYALCLPCHGYFHLVNTQCAKVS